MPHQKTKILIYSHDSFGLGHLRRCQTIAHSLVEEFADLSILILSGSPIIGSFDFRSRVDFVRIPGVIKQRNGEYTSLSLRIDIHEILAIRESIIRHTARVFDPDIFLVDKEPTGLRGEVLSTLEMLKPTRTRLILGLRDVMDDPELLEEEWARKNVVPALNDLYDEIWTYGLPDIYDPLSGLDLPDSIAEKTMFSGYLRRKAPAGNAPAIEEPFDRDPYILVTPGGGGDGVEMVDWVMRAYEARDIPLFPALIVLGPFMPAEAQADFLARAEHLRDVEIIRFTPHIEPLIENAVAMVAMGGYNTFCEILSFDKPTLLIPREVPRREQSIRAAQAKDAGLVHVLPIERYPATKPMLQALAELPKLPPPSHAGHDGLLDGLTAINRRVAQIISEDQEQQIVAEPIFA